MFISGSQTQVNTNTLTVEDSLVELGLVDGSAPGSDLNIDLGLILNYYTGSAKKAAIYWDDSTSRITIGSDVSETSSVITATTYAPLEIGQLWVNDCAGQSQVISCTGSERFLENITIDGKLLMNEEDYKSLIATYQRKSMDLFAQLVVAETKVEVLNTQLRDAKSRIQQLEEEIKSKLENKDYA